jgi:hypothetical protein
LWRVHWCAAENEQARYAAPWSVQGMHLRHLYGV